MNDDLSQKIAGEYGLDMNMLSQVSWMIRIDMRMLVSKEELNISGGQSLLFRSNKEIGGIFEWKGRIL